jgi:hypothetical protein
LDELITSTFRVEIEVEQETSTKAGFLLSSFFDPEDG